MEPFTAGLLTGAGCLAAGELVAVAVGSNVVRIAAFAERVASLFRRDRLDALVARGGFPLSGSWSGAEGSYVAMFKPGLDAVAARLSERTGLAVGTRFDPAAKRAEIVGPSGLPMAEVSVLGECGQPRAAVVAAERLDEADIPLFCDALEGLSVEFRRGRDPVPCGQAVAPV
jgi:hypothetical protein